MPTGTKITIDNNGVCLNIYVHGSMSEFSNTEGMCGNFNGKKADDLEGERVQEFNIKWRRTDSIFKGVAPSPTAAMPTYCYCVRFRKPDCRTSLDNFRCNVFDLSDITDLLVKHAKTPAPTKTTRRRRADDTPPEVGLKAPNYTNAEATKICKDMIETSKTVEICRDYLPNTTVSQSITDCTFDIETTGESDWAEAHVSTLAELCIAEARKDPDLWTGNGTTPGEPELPQDIAGGLCVKDCGQNGDCVNALCRCKNGFDGVTCQVSPDSTPVVTPGVQLCDLMTSSCGSFVVDGFNFTSSKKLTCVYTYVTPDLTPVPGVSRGTATAERINLQQVGCTMAPDQTRTALVSVRAGDVTSEQSMLYVVYNSSCQECQVAENNVTCQWKPNHCVINDKCYSNLQVDPANSCQVCDLAASTSKWTKLNVPQCTAPKVQQMPAWCQWYWWCYMYRF
ncbi:uncharacterized protein LOC131952532 [Physella acuta]|uniref:uncharacterized protein LOC131952532 n=1 Tax=Physella acuta TaxID=109671 RepID=UPI0027DC7329|nr:uncharacterized protein LOC131952532 [Physella acuta]